MARFALAIAAGAARLRVPVAALETVLADAGVGEDTFAHVTEEEWLRLLGNAPPTRDAPPWLARAARDEMARLVRSPSLSREAGEGRGGGLGLDDLVEAVTLATLDPLLETVVSGRRLRDVAFLVLDEDGQLDRAATRAVLRLLEEGAPPARDEMRDPRTGRVHVVYRADELPQALVYVDPLFPEHDLVLGISQPLQVVVRPRLADEQHQLLLLLRTREKVTAPHDRAEADDLVKLFLGASLDDLLERFAARGVYEKAARLPAGAPAGLPSIVRARRHERTAVAIAFERLDAFLRGKAAASGGAMAASAPPSVETASSALEALANRLPISTLGAILRAHGVAEPFPSPRVADYASALVGAFREGKVTFETVLSRCEKDVVRELGVTFLDEVERLVRDGRVRDSARV